MEEFAQMVDPHQIRVIMSRFEKKWVGESQFVVEVHLDGLGIAFESHKPLLEFQAFYEALEFKFRNLKFPEFP